MPTLTETFWIAFLTIASGLLLKLSSMLFKSKCSECQMCCFKIKRDVVMEEKEHEFDIEHKVNSSIKEDKNEVV